MMRLYALFMTRHNLHMLQPSEAHISEFIEYLAACGYVAKSIHSHLTAIDRFHRERGLHCQALSAFSVTSHLVGIDKTLAHRTRQAPALLPDDMEAILRCLVMRKGHEPYAFALALAYTTFIRQANLAPPSLQAFDSRIHMMRKDIVDTPQGLGLMVFWTKTRQISRSPDVIPLPRMKGSIVCPTTWWFKYKRITEGASPRGPLLVSPEGRGHDIIFQPVLLPFLRAVFQSLQQ